jgi:hypothetical protein
MVAALVINGKRAESDVNTFRYSRFAENQPVRGMYDEGLMGGARAQRIPAKSRTQLRMNETSTETSRWR